MWFGTKSSISRRPRLSHPLAQTGQRRIAAQIAMDGVAGDRESGAGDVFLSQVWQRLLKFATPLGIARETCCARRPGLPDAEEPDPIKTHLGQAVQFGVRNVIQCRGSAQLLRQFRQPDAGVDLIEGRIKRGKPSVISFFGFIMPRTLRRFRTADALEVADLGTHAILVIGKMALNRSLEQTEFLLQRSLAGRGQHMQ